MSTPIDTPADGRSDPVPVDDARVILRQTEQQLEFALRAGRLGSWEFDIDTRRFSSTAHSRIIFGLGPEDPFERLADVIARIHPDDRARRQAAIDHAIATGEEFDVEYRIFKPDGRVGWVLARGRAAFEDGRAVRLAGISLDITERKKAEEHQRLLLDELNHRVKNTLASVQSIAMQTLRHAESPEAFNKALIERIYALARGHELLAAASWDGASLTDVVAHTLQIHAGEGDRQVSVSGPPVKLGPNAAVTLNMVFHELAANAARFGALSTPQGQVDVAWSAPPEAQAVIIDWREAGGPPVAPPSRRGFGSRLIERGLTREMGGEARMDFLPEGLRCHIRLPVSPKWGLAA